MQEYSVDINKLDKLSIFQLREVGAKVGVKNPTALRTEDLKKAIIDVVTGKVPPYKKAKSGRPHKSIIPDEEWNKIVGFEDDFNMFDTNETTSLYSYSSSLNKRLEEKVLTGYTIEMFGIFLCAIGEANELQMDKCAKITTETLHYPLLQVGDKITCNIEVTDEDKLPNVTKICSINGYDVKEYASKYEEKESKYFDKTINFTLPQLQFINTNYPIKLGQRVLIMGEKDSGQTFMENSIAKDLSKEFKIVYLAIGKKPEDRITLPISDYFFTTFDIKPADLIFTYEVALNRAKNLCNNGENVIFLIDDLSSLINNYISYFKQKKIYFDTSNEEILQKIKTLFASGKNTENGSLTIITSTNNDLPTPFNEYINEITSFCNCIIYLNKEEFQNNEEEFYDKNKTWIEEEKRRNIV